MLVLGIAYKKNIDDMHESPKMEIMELLQHRGANVTYSDQWVPKFPRVREQHFELESTSMTADSLAGFDCVLIATDHDAFGYVLIHKHVKLIVDTRGVYLANEAHAVKA